MPLTNKDKDKIEIAVMSLAAVAIVIYGKMKQRSETKDYDYKKVEIEIPYGCKNLKDFVKLETEFSETVNSVFWSLRHMNHSSVTSSDGKEEYDDEDLEDNKAIIQEVEDEVDYLMKLVKDQTIKRVPSAGEVRVFLRHSTESVKHLKNLEKSVKELEDEVKDTSYYNTEYKKVARLALTVCRKYLQVYSKMISIMDKYLKNRDDGSKNESIEFLYEELLQEFSLFNKKKIPPKVIDEVFLQKLKDENIPNKQIKLKKCKAKDIYKCDVSIEKINSMISTFIKVSKKWEETLPKYFVKNFPPEMFKPKFNDETQTFSTTPPAKEKERRDILNVLGVKDTDMIEKVFLNSSEIFKNYENIQTKGKYNISINSSSLVKLTEDYLKLKEIVDSDKFRRAVEGFERFENEGKLISARIADAYKVESDSEYITNIERFLGEDIVDMFYQPAYYGEIALRVVINYKSALGDIIRRLYDEY